MFSWSLHLATACRCLYRCRCLRSRGCYYPIAYSVAASNLPAVAETAEDCVVFRLRIIARPGASLAGELLPYDFDVGSSSYFERLPDSRYHCALLDKQIFCVGLILGSSSSVPAGITTDLPILVSHGREEPQVLQNEVAKCFAAGNSYLPTEPSPSSQSKFLGSMMMLLA